MIYIIIPTYNEKENIEKLIKAIFDLQIPDLKVLIVDDNSPDGTGQIAENLKANYPVEVLHRSGKLGLGSAYRAGFKFALEKNAEYIFEMDADFSHDPKDISSMLEKAQDGADLVIGSRKVKGGKIIGWNWWRHFCSDGAMFASRLLLNLKTKDVTSGFRCFRTETLKKINYQRITSNGYAFQIEMVYQLEKGNFKIQEVPVIFSDRQKGKSKLGKKEIIDFFKTILRLKFKKDYVKINNIIN
ncbi:polyprenol monophosphomannose synthase [Patescibacteria group bacterium]|nr:polyprenol monophosphomannose synthase [Patescibacteria group bacterium]